MGSDKKSKEKRKRNSDDEETSKRHRDTEEKSGKSDKREKRKDKKSHKHRSGDEKKSKDKSKSKSLKPDHPLRDIQKLSTDDYFAKNNEFSTWLKEEKRVFFSDLSSESAREMFADFVNAWNKQKLDSRYYEGIVSGPRTAHNWKIRQ